MADHAADYSVCITALALLIADPTFIGQAPGQARNFEMVHPSAIRSLPAVLLDRVALL